MKDLKQQYAELIMLALEEDIGNGDLTSAALISKESQGTATIIAKEPCIVCGQDVVSEVFRKLEPNLEYKMAVPDGSRVSKNEVLGRVSGSLRSILTAERTALNFLQRLSGISSATERLVKLVSHTGVKIRDTRKTIPGWRALDKYAVLKGGGENHRFGLFDAVLIKNNHIDARLGTPLGTLVEECRRNVPPGTKVQIEVRNENELEEALMGNPDSILFDNFDPKSLSSLVTMVRGKNKSIDLEASGGITEDSILNYCVPGLSAISVGFITHSAKAADIALRYKL